MGIQFPPEVSEHLFRMVSVSGGPISYDEPLPETIALTPEQVDALEELAYIRREKAELTKREERVKKEIIGFLGHATTGVLGSGATAVTVKELTRTGVDSKKLEAMYPDVYSDVRTQTTYKRVDLGDLDQ